MTAEAWQIVFFTIEVSALSTLLILPSGIAIAWLIARREWPGKSLVETIVMLPLFVPPVATGFVLLMLFGRHGPLGSILQRGAGIDIVFTWRAVVLAGAVMSFPLLVRTAQSAFQEVNTRFEDIARTLGAGEWRVFSTISLPLALPGVTAGTVLAFRAGDGGIRGHGCCRRDDSAPDDDDFISDLPKYPARPRLGRRCLCSSSRSASSSSLSYADSLSQGERRTVSLRLHGIRLPLTSFTLEVDATFARPIVGIFGPSGAGKTSLLDLIVGLRRATAGTVELGDTVLSDAGASLHLPPRVRRIGYVPQDLALFPHLSVRANLVYGYQAPRSENEVFTLEHVSEVMEITPLFGRNVTTLSGGEQQRVAFARAILSVPRLLLLDEPMSSLDSRLKRRLIPFLHRIRDEFRIPLIYVTHDAGELASLCDEIILLERGRVIDRGLPRDVLPESQ